MPDPGAGTRPAAVVFDCDGTLVDTERISDDAFRQLLPRYGYEVTEQDMAAIRGRPWPHTWARFRDQIGLTDEAAFRAAYREVFVALFHERARYFDDAVATIEVLRADGVPLAVCTSSSRGHLERVLDLGLRGAFAVTVAADDTATHKPEPGPYLEAARRLAVDPQACSAAEDSTVGVASAKAAGMWTVGIVRPGHDNGDVAAADIVVDELTVGALYGSP